MIIYPAIDIKDQKCVRLLKGDMESAEIFNDNAVAQAKEFEKAGLKNLHLVDLNGAVNNSLINKPVIEDIIRNIKIPAQLGGGIRNIDSIEKWLSIGVNRVILGTIAVTNPEIVKEACKKFPGKIAVGIDSMNGKVKTDGWVKESNINTVELAKKLEDYGVSAIIYTDISKDGAMTGPDLKGTTKLAESIDIPVIASGGVSSLSDVLELRKLVNSSSKKSGVKGAIIGRAIYEKKILLKDLVNLQT